MLELGRLVLPILAIFITIFIVVELLFLEEDEIYRNLQNDSNIDEENHFEINVFAIRIM